MNHIVLATDLSSETEHAHLHAAQLARTYGALITLVHINDATEWEILSRFRTDHREKALKLERNQRTTRLQKSLVALQALGVQVTSRLLEGRPTQSLLRFARESDADLIVLTKRSEDNLKRWLLGSITRKILRSSHLPVLLLDGHADLPEPGEISYRRILATTDFSDVANKALPSVVELARSLDAELLITHVFRQLIAGPSLPGVQSVTFSDQLDAITADVRRELDGVVRALPKPYERIETQVAVSQSISDALTSLAEERDVDLIVMPSHGKGAFASTLIGSNTERMLRLSERPMLVIPPKD